MERMKRNPVGKVLTKIAAAMVCSALIALSSAAEAARVVVIDPAHGGDDAGVKLSSDAYEKDAVLAIAVLTQEALAKTGSIKAVLTRSKDETVSIEKRRACAEKAKAKLFISLHINAGFGPKAAGYEIGVSGLADLEEKADNSKAVVKDMISNQYLNESLRFAQILQRALKNVFPRQGRGIRSADFAILGDVDCPAVVVEMGFATNVENRKTIRDKDVQKKLAGGIAESIREYFK